MTAASEKIVFPKLHLSFSQLFTYLACSLKYRLRYIDGQSPERISLALPFGSALHRSLERYYRSLTKGNLEKLETLQTLFCEVLSHELESKGELVFFPAQTPDTDSAIKMGQGMLKVFYNSIDPNGLDILAVEKPLSARLYTDQGQATEVSLVGVIDLLLKDSSGNIVIVDHKTAARAKNQADVDADLQMSVYTYLLAANRYLLPTSTANCRFDVFRKLKTPKFEQYHTKRTAEDRRRLAKIAGGVLAGIEAGIFIPHRSWMCGDCEYAHACARWHCG